MISRFQQNKLLQLFARLDRSGDGFIEYVDFMLCYDVLREAKGWSAEHEGAQRLLRTSRALWDQLCGAIDLNGDGRISREEWTTFFGRLHDRVKGQEPPAWMLTTARLFYGWLDLDGNGAVSEEEYSFYLQAIGAEVEPGAFAAVAGVGEGSQEQFFQGFSAWLFSLDPQDPVNYLLTGAFPYVKPAEIELKKSGS